MLRSIAAALVMLSIVPPALAQSLEQMAGQMIVVGFDGDDVTDAGVKSAVSQIEAGILGGVMYLRYNVKSLAEVKAMNRLFRAASPGLPPFITIDQEGGAVERLTESVGFTELPSARTVAGSYSPAGAQDLYAGMARDIAELGFSVNFGPVVDLDINPDNQIIARYGRAFGKSADTVAAYAEAFVAAHHEAGLITALKHFPGHGSSTADSHDGFVDISRTWSESELEPYRIMFADGYNDMVMVGHLYHSAQAGEDGQLPASLSPGWINGVLRGQLGFGGVVISDDLDMGAITKLYDLDEAVIRAVRAGSDVLLFSNASTSLPRRVREILIAEAESDPAFRSMIEASYARIVALKARIGG